MNVLKLYRKAQTQSLEAQEIAWIDQTTREHPYFGVAHMVAARHHLSEKTTIKDNALMVGATYALDRNLLHAYVADTIAAPRQTRAQSLVTPAVVEPITKAEDQLPEPEQAPEISEPAELPADLPEEMPEPSPVELPDLPEQEPAEEPEPQIVPEEDPIVEPEEAPEEEPEVAPDFEPAPKEDNSTPASDPQPSTFTSAAEPVKVGINWFLNMRLKLKTNKYAALSTKIKASVAAHAQSMDAQPVAIAVLEERPVEKVLNSKAEIALDTSKKDTKDSYEIGSFSSFTFLPDANTGESSEQEAEALVIDTDLMAVEASLDEEADGELIFEEEGRILEIVISPALRERFFKGRMPLELNFGSFDDYTPVEKTKEIVKPKPEPKAAKAKLSNSLEDPEERRLKAQALIDRFIELEPVVSKNALPESGNYDFSKESNVETDEWVTETLAKIYAQQGNRSKAIKIYQKLSLLFPEKKNYFASRIAELK